MTHNIVLESYNQYWKDQFANANNSRQFWKTVNRVHGRQYSSRIGPLKDHNDLEVLDDGLKAQLFNQYFANIGKEIAESFPEENQSIFRHIYSYLSYLLYIGTRDK